MKYFAVLLLIFPGVCLLRAQTPRSTGCHLETLEGEVQAGQLFRRPIGAGLDVMLQPIHSGWILRVVPHTIASSAVGASGFIDFAQLATPPYQSITPLSISTDFAFRAQDAVGWNPRRFHFAASQTIYNALLAAYRQYSAGLAAGVTKGQLQQQRERELATLVAASPEGVLTLLDAKLVPGAADQWAGAAAVSARFTETAHTLVLPAQGEATPLGKILAFKFRLQFNLPVGFAPSAGSRSVSQVCSNR